MRLLDRLCDEFEAGWARGRPVSLQSAMARVPVVLKSRAFQDLLTIELDYRFAAGEQPAWADYFETFPGCEDVVHHLFQRLNSQRLKDRDALSSDHSV